MCVYVCFYLRAIFDVSSIILKSFRQWWDNFIPKAPQRQNETLKCPPRLGLRKL